MNLEPGIVLIGGGRFGRLALKRLGHRIGTVVDPQPEAQLRELAQAAGAELLADQGATALNRILRDRRPAPVWVIPALPRHLLVEWLLIACADRGAQRLSLPDGALPEVPVITPGPEGQMLLSLADFLCPDDCPEPALNCTVTGLPRGKPLFTRLAEIELPGWSVGVIRSHQLAPGVGGCRVADLLALKGRIAGRGGLWLAATACRCHGVLGALGLPAPY